MLENKIREIKVTNDTASKVRWLLPLCSCYSKAAVESS